MRAEHTLSCPSDTWLIPQCTSALAHRRRNLQIGQACPECAARTLRRQSARILSRAALASSANPVQSSCASPPGNPTDDREMRGRKITFSSSSLFYYDFVIWRTLLCPPCAYVAHMPNPAPRPVVSPLFPAYFASIRAVPRTEETSPPCADERPASAGQAQVGRGRPPAVGKW